MKMFINYKIEIYHICGSTFKYVTCHFYRMCFKFCDSAFWWLEIVYLGPNFYVFEE